MIVAEMHDAVRLGLDKNSNLPLPSFIPEEINYWLNEAQLQLIKQKAFGTNARKEAFEGSIKRIEDLSPLVTTSSNMPIFAHPFYPNVGQITKTDVSTGSANNPYMFYVESMVMIARNGNPSDTALLETQVIKHEDIKKFIETEFNIPSIRKPLVFFYEDKIGFIHDPYHYLLTAFVTYIRKPKEMVLTAPEGYETIVCELPEQVHPEVVAIAINMILENIESPRQQTQAQQLIIKE